MTSETMSRAESLVTTCAERAWRLACALVWNPEDARDVVQQAFLVAAAKAGSIPPDNPWPWFARVLTLEALKLRTSRAKRARLKAELLGREPAMTTTDPAQDSDNRDLNERLHAALHGLSPDVREALSLTQIGGMSVRDAAETLGVSSSTLDRRVQEGIGQLRRRLGVSEAAATSSLMALPFAAPPEGMQAAIKGWLNAVRLEQSLIGAGSATGVKVIGATLMAKYSVLVAVIVLAAVLIWAFVIRPNSEAGARRNALGKDDIAATRDTGGSGRAGSNGKDQHADSKDVGEATIASNGSKNGASEPGKADGQGSSVVTETKPQPEPAGTGEAALPVPATTPKLLSLDKSKQQAPAQVLGAPGPWDNGSCIRCLATLPDNKKVLTGCDGGLVVLWDIESGRKEVILDTKTKDAVAGLCVSNDGAMALTSGGNRLLLWTLKDRTFTRLPLADNQIDIRGCAFSADNRTAATLVYTGECFTKPSALMIWDVASRKLARSIEVAIGQYNSIAFVGDSSEVLVSGEALLRFDASDGKLIERLDFEGAGEYCSSRLSPDGRTVAVWNAAKGELSVLDARSLNAERKAPFKLVGKNGEAPDVDNQPQLSWRRDSRQLLMYSGDNIVSIDVFNGEISGKFSTGGAVEQPTEIRAKHWIRGYLMAVGLTPDGKRLVGASSDGRLVAWNTETGSTITPAGDANSPANFNFIGVISGLVFASDSQLIISDGRLSKWDIKNTSSANSPATIEENLVVFAVQPDGSRVFAFDDYAAARALDLTTMKVSATFSHDEDTRPGVLMDPPQCAALCPGRPLMAVCYGVETFLWDTESGRKLGHFKDTALPADEATSIQFSADGKSFITGHWSGTLRVWDTDKFEPRMTISTGQSGRAIAIDTKDGLSVVNCSPKGDLQCFSATDGSLMRKHRFTTANYSDVKALQLVPGTNRVALYYDNGDDGPQLKIFDLQTGELVAHLSGHDGRITAMAISPDGKTLATGGEDRVVKLWNLSE